MTVQGLRRAERAAEKDCIYGERKEGRGAGQAGQGSPSIEAVYLFNAGYTTRFHSIVTNKSLLLELKPTRKAT